MKQKIFIILRQLIRLLAKIKDYCFVESKDKGGNKEDKNYIKKDKIIGMQYKN